MEGYMISFYDYMRSYNGTDIDKKEFCDKYINDELFPKGRNLLGNFEFWKMYCERYLESIFCTQKELESFRRLFSSYRNANKDLIASSNITTQCGIYTSAFSVREDIYLLTQNVRIPQKSRQYYENCLIVYDEFLSLYVLPPNASIDSEEIREFISWWVQNNLPKPDPIDAKDDCLKLNINGIKDLLEECTSLSVSTEKLKEILTKLGYDLSVEYISFSSDLPVARRKFIDEPSKKKN